MQRLTVLLLFLPAALSAAAGKLPEIQAPATASASIETRAPAPAAILAPASAIPPTAAPIGAPAPAETGVSAESAAALLGDLSRRSEALSAPPPSAAAGDGAMLEARGAAGEAFDRTPRGPSASAEALAAYDSPSTPDAPAESGLRLRGPPRRGASRDGLGLDFLLRVGLRRGTIEPELGASLRQAAYRDPLTGLRNRIDLDEHLPALLAGHKSLVVFKLDSLKEVNDSEGKEAGNRLLKGIAALAEAAFGPRAALFRRSPTGFAAFVDEPARSAAAAAEVLRALAEGKLGPSGTINAGIAAIAPAATAAQAYRSAFRRAEKGRLLAKESGGNLVAAESEDGTRPLPRQGIAAALKGVAPAARLGVALSAARIGRESLDEVLRSRAAPGSTAAPTAGLLDRVRDAELREALHRIVYHDRLSGLANRKWLFENLPRLLGPGGYTHFIALDIDKFGAIDRKLPDEGADGVLRELGGLLAHETAGRDAVALHVSGEEFVVLTGPGIADPRAFAEDLRAAVERDLGARAAANQGVVDPETGRPFPVTISLGVSELRPDPAGPDQVLTLAGAMAEAMLQRAKDNGRNRVESGVPAFAEPDLLARLARVIRVDEPVRRMVRRLFSLLKPKA